MFVRRLPPPCKSQKLLDLYVTTLKVNFHDEPAKYYKFYCLLNDYKARRINLSNLKPRVEEIMKDHPKLLLGLSVFFPKDSVYLPEARVSPSPGLTMEDASLYMDSVEEAFYEEPAKYDEFLKILLTAHSADEANAIAKKLEELMKDHQNLLKGFSVFLSAEPKITIPPESVAPRNNKRKRAKSDGVGFMNKRKTRSRGRDTDAATSIDLILMQPQVYLEL